MTTRNAKAKIAVLGGSVIDLAFVLPKLSQWNQAVQASSFRMYPGGKGLNQAIAASRIGAEVNLISAIGEDEFGTRIIEMLDVDRVAHDYVRVVKNEYTDVTAVLVNNQGRTSYIGWKNTMIRSVNRTLVKSARDIITEADAILITLEVSLEAVEESISIANESGTKVFLNPAPPPEERLPTDLLRKADFLLTSTWEAASLLGISDEKPEELARQLHQIGIEVVCVTTINYGCFVAENGKVIECSSLAIGNPIDATGGSDAFCASLAVSICSGETELRNALSKARAASALAIGKRGGSPSMPTSKEIANYLEGLKVRGHSGLI